MQPDPISNSPIAPMAADPEFARQVQRLYRLTLVGRCLVVMGLWLSVGGWSIWGLRYPLSLLHDYFTWAAVRYGLAYHLVPAFGLFLCVGMTLAVLLWWLRNGLLGLPAKERRQLEQRVCHIRQQGVQHPLWKFVCQDDGLKRWQRP